MSIMRLDQDKLFRGSDINENPITSESAFKKYSSRKSVESIGFHRSDQTIGNKIYVSLFVCIGLLLWTMVVVLKVHHKVFRSDK